MELSDRTTRAHYVREMFGRIADRYDLMNRLMTFGQDSRWRREVVRRAGPVSSGRILDVGTGTGDLLREAQRRNPDALVAGADFTLEMMRTGRRKGGRLYTGADALQLPFAAGTFDAVVSGFLVRNVVDLPQALAEQHRVLRSGGRIVILDTTRPGRSLFSPLVWLQLRVVIPMVGKLVSSFSEAYRYLPQTTEQFLAAEELAAEMAVAGFRGVAYRRLMLGTIAIHWATRP